MPVYNFKCECGSIYEEITSGDTKFIKCSNCGKLAKKIPSAPALKLMTTKKKELLKKITGREIDSLEEEKKYLKEHNLIQVSKKEWESIKMKRDNRWNNYDYDRNKIKDKAIEGIKKIIENKEERRRINLYNLKEGKELAEKIAKDSIENAKI